MTSVMGLDRWVERTASQAERRSLAVFVCVLLFIVGSMALLLSGSAAPLAALPLVGLAFLGRMYFDLQLDIAGMKRRGADAEAAVGAALDALIGEGYYVLHDLESVMSGNVDHVISGPTGVCLIETKSRTFKRRDLTRTKCAARLVAGHLGVRFVIPVICIHSRPDVLWRQEKVDIVGIDRLAGFIQSRKQQPAALDALTALAARG
jgi:Nuclease-related domain